MLTCRGSKLPRPDPLHRVLPDDKAQLAPPPGRPQANLVRRQVHLARSPPCWGGQDTLKEDQAGVHTFTHRHVCLLSHTHTHTHTHVCSEGSRLPWGSGPMRQDLQEIQMLPRLSVSQRACGRKAKSGRMLGACPVGAAAATAAAERGGKEERLGPRQPGKSTPRLGAASPAKAAQLCRVRAGHRLSPYLAHTGWRGPSSVCLRSWSPHTRTCLGPTPRCSQSARHLWGHKDNGQACDPRRGLDSIYGLC